MMFDLQGDMDKSGMAQAIFGLVLGKKCADKTQSFHLQVTLTKQPHFREDAQMKHLVSSQEPHPS
jgi:hypothetical protein